MWTLDEKEDVAFVKNADEVVLLGFNKGRCQQIIPSQPCFRIWRIKLCKVFGISVFYYYKPFIII